MITKQFKWILVSSLILNIFLASTIIGGAYRLFWSDQSPFANKVAQRGLRFAADNLSAERQQTFHKMLRETRRDARPLIKSGQAARAEVREQLAAPEFDRGAISKSLAQAREADIALRIRIEGALVDFAQNLNADEREKLAEGLARQGPLRQAPLANNL